MIGMCLTLPGCARLIARDSCPTNDQTLPAEWTAMNLPVMEGGEITCVWNETQATMMYRDIEPLEFADKYAEKLDSNGWKVGPLTNFASFTAAKSDKSFSVKFDECPKSLTSPSTWTRCTQVGVTETR